MRIFKYPLRITDIQTVKMPYKSKVLTAQFQNNELVVWAEVDETSRPCETLFLVIGTGNPFPDVDMKDYRYVGTVQQHGGILVWHIYVEDLHLQRYKLVPA